MGPCWLPDGRPVAACDPPDGPCWPLDEPPTVESGGCLLAARNPSDPPCCCCVYNTGGISQALGFPSSLLYSFHPYLLLFPALLQPSLCTAIQHLVSVLALRLCLCLHRGVLRLSGLLPPAPTGVVV